MRRTGPGHQLYRVGEEALQHHESVLHHAGRAGEVDDQSLPPRAGDAARQPGPGEVWRRAGPQRLRDPGGRPLQHGPGRLGRHVPFGESRAAGRQDDVHIARVRPTGEHARDAIALVGHHTAQRDLVAPIPRPRDDRIAGRVGALSQRAQIGDREDPDTQTVHFPRAALTASYRPAAFVLLGTKGIVTVSAVARLPRTSISKRFPARACSAGRYAVPMAAFTVGVTVPLRTTPSWRPSK